MSAADRSPTKVWRVETPVRRLAVVVAWFSVLVATLLTAIGIVVLGAVLVWAIAIAVMFGVWRWYLVPYVELGPDRLLVQGAFSRRSLRYRSIRRVAPGPIGLQVETGRDGSVLIWAIQKSKFAEWSHRDTRADRVAAEIMERVESSR